MSVTLIIDSHHIALRENADVSALTEQIVAAVRQGGDFVRVEDTHGLTLDILCTPLPRVTIRRSEATTVEAQPSDRDWTPSIDVDF